MTLNIMTLNIMTLDTVMLSVANKPTMLHVIILNAVLLSGGTWFNSYDNYISRKVSIGATTFIKTTVCKMLHPVFTVCCSAYCRSV